MKHQASLEFMVLLGFILFFFTMFLIVINSNIYDKNKEKEQILVKNLATSIRDEINLAATSSSGYSRTFYIEDRVFGKEYELNLSQDILTVYTDRVSYSVKVKNVTGSLTKGKNIITKENGEIHINS